MTRYDHWTNEALVELAKNGTPKERSEAMEAIVEKNDNLILHLIGRFFSSYKHSYADDMRQEGRTAIFEQATRYDPKRGTFSTFISPYIIDAIKLYICQVHGISTHYSSQIKRYRKAVEALQARGIEKPTYGDIAEEMHVGIDAVQRVHDVCCRVNAVSIEGDNKDRELCSPYETTPDAICERDDLCDRIAKAIHELPVDQRNVINESFFRSSDNKETPLADVAKALGLDVSTVRRLKNLALRRLEQSQWLNDFDNSTQRRQIDDFGQSLTITFTMPAELVEANVNIALSLAPDEDVPEISI